MWQDRTVVISTSVDSFRLDGRTALVSGAGSGIGAAVAAGLAAFGARVGCADIGDAAPVAERIASAGGEAIALRVDVTDPASLDGAVTRVEAELGPLSLAVNSAGVHSTAPAEEMAPAVWQRLVDVSLSGLFWSCQAEGRAMLRNGGGSIVNLGSISAHIANRGLKQAHYNAVKAAVVALSRSLALEWADRGVRVNTLSPGYVKTPLARGAETDRTLEDFVDDVPLRRMADPAEMVGPAVLLLSDAGSYCTGSELVVDGGATGW
jgi:NAD(P)-dependent dehydrogenase (short-subunit alcohol dehydrogenase family)